MRLGINERKSNAGAVYEGYRVQQVIWQSRGIQIQKGALPRQAKKAWPLDRLRIYADVPADEWPNPDTAHGCFQIAETIGSELGRIEREYPGVIPIEDR